jgi:hypothetical protein
MLIRTHCRSARQFATVSKTGILTGSFLALMLPGFLLGQDKGQPEIDQSCRRFIETSYAGFAARASLHGPVPALEWVLGYEPRIFNSDLFLQLREDSEAQKKAGGDIVGLDFDPFLACQDCDGPYKVEKTELRDCRCWAEVHSVDEKGESPAPRVIPELMLKDGKWVFVNFHYPNPERPEFENLLSLLKSLREYRARRAEMESKKR